MERDDREIMQRVQDGQLSLFDELVRRYRGPLHRVAADKLGDAGRAEDVVQETFLAVYASRHTYKPEFSFRTWLWTILLNLCRRELAKRKGRPRELPTPRCGRNPQTPGSRTGHQRNRPHAGAASGNASSGCSITLSKLTDVQADAIRLRFFGELKYSEIAQTMGCSEITAKVRVRNGLETLSKWLVVSGEW